MFFDFIFEILLKIKIYDNQGISSNVHFIIVQAVTLTLCLTRYSGVDFILHCS